MLWSLKWNIIVLAICTGVNGMMIETSDLPGYFSIHESQILHHHQLRHNNDRLQLEIIKNEFDEMPCNTEDMKRDIIENKDKVACQPRKTILPLNYSSIFPKPTLLNPGFVEVHWCIGFCDMQSFRSCVPKEVKTISIPVIAVSLKSPTETESKCIMVNVKEHASCECACAVQEKHCDSKKQQYNAHKCQCECKNETQDLVCTVGKRWNPARCECECPKINICSSNSHFSHEECRCVGIKRARKLKSNTWRAKLKAVRKKD